MPNELTKRVAVAAVGIPFAVAVVYVGGWAMAAVLSVIAAAATVELYRMARQRGVQPFVVIGALLAAVPILAAVLAPDPVTASAWTWVIFLATSLYIATAAIFRRGVDGAPLTSTAVTTFGALFTGGTLAYAIFLRGLEVAGSDPRWTGPALVLFPLVLTWISDSCAYFGGRAFGRRKLIPSVSPGKTVAGAVAGVLGTAVAGAVYAQLVLMAIGVPITLLSGALAGLLISPAAQLGDLAESLLKREAGVKDSGALLPGHGGVLDRFDSLLFAFPVTYWFVALMLGRGAL